MDDEITYWIVDDHEGFRENLIMVLGKRGFRCLNSLPNAAGLFSSLMGKGAPSIVLCDIRMPGIDGIEVVKELKCVAPNLPVLLLTSFDNEPYLLDAMRAGAAGFLLKTSTVEEIDSAIRAALAGGLPIDPDMSGLLVKRTNLGASSSEEEGLLSPQEQKILQSLAEGNPAKATAAKLQISINTVDSHIRKIYQKLEVQNQAAAVAEGFRRGLIV